MKRTQVEFAKNIYTKNNIIRGIKAFKDNLCLDSYQLQDGDANYLLFLDFKNSTHIQEETIGSMMNHILELSIEDYFRRQQE